MNVIFGSAGFAKEVDLLLFNNNPLHKTDFFIGANKDVDEINSIKVISDNEFITLARSCPNKINAFIAIGLPQTRYKIFNLVKEIDLIKFLNAISTKAEFDRREYRIKMGMGNILCSNSVLTTDITMGSFNNVHVCSTIGHDTIIGNFCTFSPGSNISGYCDIGDQVFVGAGAVILEKLSICDNVVIGAGSVVTKSIAEQGTYVGVPARRIK